MDDLKPISHKQFNEFIKGLATLYLEVTSISARMYLYLFPYNVSEGMYNRSN